MKNKKSVSEENTERSVFQWLDTVSSILFSDFEEKIDMEEPIVPEYEVLENGEKQISGK